MGKEHKSKIMHEDIDPLPSGLGLDCLVEAAEAEVLPSKAVLRCYNCRAFGNPHILRCAYCRCTYFCSKECQRSSWQHEHKAECAGIRAHVQEEREVQRQHLELAATLIEEHQATSPSSSFTCSVCLDDQQEGDGHNPTMQLPCGHRFCYRCIQDVQYSAYKNSDGSIETNRCYGSCPQCRQPIPYLEHIVADRVLALTQMARTKLDPHGRDAVCQVALQLLDFWLQREPGKPILQMLRGHTYKIMQDYEQALLCYQKAYNVHKKMIQESLRNPEGTVLSSHEQYEERVQQVRDLALEEPATDFPSNIKDLEQEIVPFLRLDPGVLRTLSEIFLSIASATLHRACACDDDDREGKVAAALGLVLLVRKLNKPLSDQCGGRRPVDMDCTIALAECLVALGKLDQAKALVRPAICRFRFHAGFHKILVECERKEGNLERALYYAAKGYFYEEVWNEVGTRAKNLQLWKEIRQSLGQQQQKQKDGAQAYEMANHCIDPE